MIARFCVGPGTSDLNDKLKEALTILNAPATRQLALKSVMGIDDE